MAKRYEETLLLKIMILITFGIIIAPIFKSLLKFDSENLLVGLILLIVLIVMYDKFRDLL